MRVFFMGTPQLAIPVLRNIIESKHELLLVVTIPDKPAGRQQKLTPPPVKLFALEEGIPVVQPPTLKDESFRIQIQDMRPDIGVVFAYGKIIPIWLLDLPRYGIINVHPSLLPRWRGAAPIQRAIMADDKITGVSIIQLSPELDAGDILMQAETPIKPEDTAETLALQLSNIAGKLVLATLDGLERGEITPRKQDETGVVYAGKITDDDEEIRWEKPADVIRNQVRALNPKPGAHTHVNGMMLKVWRAVRPSEDVNVGFDQPEPGTIVYIDKNRGPYIATGTEPLLLVEVQPANKKKMTGAEFVRGYRLAVGDRLG
ncbi:MAG TPA: methionyl-tRNA formyltransferase [Candidatus Aquicultor sp.]|jgi:methionyl-tRNA formyltransferase